MVIGTTDGYLMEEVWGATASFSREWRGEYSGGVSGSGLKLTDLKMKMAGAVHNVLLAMPTWRGQHYLSEKIMRNISCGAAPILNITHVLCVPHTPHAEMNSRGGSGR